MSVASPREDERQDCWSTIGVWGDVQPRCPLLAELVHCRNCEVFTEAGRGVLDQAAPEGYLEAWSRELAREQEDEDVETVSLLAFRIGSERLALPAQVFEQVAAPRPVRSIPHRSSPFLLGLVSLSGRFLLCVSLAELLGLQGAGTPLQGDRPQERLLVLNDSGQLWVFPVDEVLSVSRFTLRDLSQSPATVARSGSRFSKGVFDLDGEPVGYLDDGLIISGLRSRLR